MARSLRSEEEAARHILGELLGVSVVQHDDGSADGMHDLSLRYSDRPPGAVEVTLAADSECIELWKVLSRPSARWEFPELAGGWVVSTNPSARAKELRKELPDLLRQLEAAGVTQVEPEAYPPDPWADRLEQLGITSLWQSRETSYPGSVYPLIDEPRDRTGGFVPLSGNGLATWLSDFLSSPGLADVRRKLMGSGAAERHAFIVVPMYTPANFDVRDLLMRDGAPRPDVPPSLPPEITDVWVMSTRSTGPVFHWSNEAGWTHFSKPGATKP